MSGGLLVLAPLRAEAAAVRCGLGRTGRVVRVGMGRERAGRVMTSPALAGADAVVVAGVAGAVAPQLSPGDVVVATALVLPDGSSRSCPDGAALAAHLRLRGCSVTLGPIAGVERLTGPAGRARLVGRAIAVDMESPWLHPAGDRVFAVVRVIVDTAGRRLLDPRTMLAGVRALLVLRRVGQALRDWKPPAPGTIPAP